MDKKKREAEEEITTLLRSYLQMTERLWSSTGSHVKDWERASKRINNATKEYAQLWSQEE